MPNPPPIRKILVINLAYIGDIILSTPAMRALKKTYQQAEIHLLVIPAVEPAAQGNPYVDKVIVYDKRGKDRNLMRLLALIRLLRAEKYDLAVAMNFSLRSPLIAWVSGARLRLGYDARHAAAFLTHTASPSRSLPRHETENHLALLRPLGIEDTDTSLEFRVDQRARESLAQKKNITQDRPVVVVCPYGRHPLNSWTDAGYCQLLRALAPVAECFLIGGIAEKTALEGLNTAAGQAATVLAGALNISELAALLERSSLLVTVDTGPLHIAAAVGTPILGIFGRSDFRIWGPRGSLDRVICRKPDCWPCYQRECAHHRCMKEITMEEVITTALGMLAQRR